MAIIMNRGDQGETDLLFGKKAQKTSERIEALGAVDELNAHLGMARLYAGDDLIAWVDQVQKALVNLMGELATLPEDRKAYLEKGYGTISEEEIQSLERLAKEQEEQGNTFKGWVRPGQDGSTLRAQIHVCRTVCRRAERRTWAVEMESRLPSIYLNRLADTLWLLGSGN